MLTVIETPIFQRMVVDVLQDTERHLLINWIAGNPLAKFDNMPASVLKLWKKAYDA